jgi:hypothetical protein
MEKIEILGVENAFKVASLLLHSGYSIHIPYMPELDKENKEDVYVIIECSFTKYDEPQFILQKEEDF